MENLTELLEKLADKLGTTSEYLFGVLVNQAPISALYSALYLILVLLGGYLLYKLHISFLKQDGNNCSLYSKYGVGIAIPMILSFIAWLVLFIKCFHSIENIMTGFLNPEYWALDEIMSLIK